MIPLDDELQRQTTKLLDELRFTGPFELEFVETWQRVGSRSSS